MPSSLLGLLWSSTQFALIRQSITIRSVCHTSTQKADVAPSKKPPSLNWGRHTLARALWLSRRCQRSRSSIFPLFVDKGVAPSCFTDMSFHQKLQRKCSAEMFPACLCHRLSLCIQHNIIRSFVRLHIFLRGNHELNCFGWKTPVTCCFCGERRAVTPPQRWECK